MGQVVVVGGEDERIEHSAAQPIMSLRPLRPGGSFVRSAALLVALAGCGETPPTAIPSGPLRHSLTAATAPARVIAIGTNYISGTAWSVSANGASSPLPLGATGDTVVRPLGDVLAVLNRVPGVSDNITLLEERDGALALAAQIPLVRDDERSTSAYANPHDVIALDANTLLVARWNLPSLAVVDVALGTITRTIDLSPYRGTAPLPNADAMYRVGDRIYVSLQRLDDVIRPTQNGMVVQLDAGTLAVTATIELPFVNPVGRFQPVGQGRARLAAVGWYERGGDAGIVELDLRGDAPAVQVVVRDEDLPANVRGNIDGLALIDEDLMVLKVAGERRPNMDIDVLRVLRYDRRTRAVRVLVERRLWSGAAPVVLGSTVFVGDPGETAGYRGAGVRRFTLAGDPMGSEAAVGVEMFPYDLQAAP